MGLPTPNIFTGCGNFHGPFEYASIDVMEKAVHVVVGIAQEVANSHQSYNNKKPLSVCSSKSYSYCQWLLN